MLATDHLVRRLRPVLLLTLSLSSRAIGAPDAPLLRIEAGGHTAAIRQVLFMADGSRLVSVGKDKVVRIWDIEQGKQIGAGLRYPVGPGSQGGIFAAALSKDGRLAVGGYDVTETAGPGGEFGVRTERHAVLRLFDLAAGTMRTVETGHKDLITSLAFSPNGAALASGSVDGKVILSDAAAMRPLRTLDHKNVVSGVAFSADGALLATACYDGSVRVWEVATGRLRRTLSCGAPVQCVAWSPVAGLVASGSTDARIRLWDAETGKEARSVTQPDNPTCLAFSPDGARLLSGSGENPDRNDRKARLWSVAAGRLLQEYAGHTGTVLAVAFPPAGADMVASADLAGVIHLWDPATGRTIRPLRGTGVSIYRVGWSADGKSVAWGTAEAGGLRYSYRLYEAAPGPDLKEGDQAAWRQAVVERNGRRLTIANPGPQDLQKAPEVMAAGAGGDARIAGEPGDRIRCCTFTPDGRIAVGSEFALTLYDASGKRLRRLLGHTGSVLDLAPSPDGAYLASASSDQTVRIWSLKDAGRAGSIVPLLSLFPAHDGSWVAWSEDGYYAASPSGDDIIGWQVDAGRDRPAELRTAFQMHARFYRPDVVSLLLETGSVREALKRAAGAQPPPPEGETAAATAAKLPTVELVEVGPAVREGDGWIAKSQKVKVRVRVGNLAADDTLLLRVNRPETSRRLAQAERAERPDERLLDAALAQGANVLTVIARNAAGESLPLAVRVTWDAPAGERKPQNLRVLAVGVSSYSDSRIDPLKYADRDADEIATLYRGQGGRLFDSVTVDRFTNAEATRRSVMAALDSMQASLGPEDTAILFFSSHGFEDKGSFYFALNDAVRDRLDETGVSWQAVLKRLETLNARNVLLIVDQCYSGGVQEELVRGYRPANEALRAVRQANVLTFAASAADQLSWEHPKWQHGAFTYALLMALRGEAPDMRYPEGRVLLNRAEDFVIEEVERIVEQTVGSRQTPSLFALPGGYTRIPIAVVPASAPAK